MSFFTTIRTHEIGLVLEHGDVVRVLGPGRHVVWPRPFRGRTVEVFDVLSTRFEHPRLDVLIDHPALREQLEIVDLTDEQRALVWKDGRLFAIVGPGRHAFWKRPYRLEVETIAAGAERFQHPRMDAILRHADAPRHLRAVRIDPWERVLFLLDGEPVGTHSQGVVVFWIRAANLTWKSLDLREQVLDVQGQEIMTADRVTLRVNLVVAHRVVDVERAVANVLDPSQALHREAQLTLREAVGARTLDALLTAKESVAAEMGAAIAARAATFGVAVVKIGLRDVILPGEMKTILNQVIEAQKRAEADLIRRREETAAARSQANTARLLDASPTLRRMKELEALQAVLAGAKTTFVLGPGDLSAQVQSLVASDPRGPQT
jgi:regulator of protease activity HflC (stomatin/prohibitin superfamily)